MPTVRLRLAELRARRRLSQRQVAAAAGLRPDTVSALERGKSGGIHFDTLARLCEVLSCRPGDLLEFEPDGHLLPVLGGPDEDDLVQQRLADKVPRVDGPTFMAELLRLQQANDGPAGR